MKDALLRQQKDRLLQPIVKRFFGKISPNTLSLVAVIPGVLAALAVLEHAPLLGLLLWLLNRFLDGLDGLVARVHNKKSDWGGYLDLLLDFVVYLAVPIAFVIAWPMPEAFWALVFLLVSYQMNTLSWTLLAALIEKRQTGPSGRLTSIEMPVGLIEGTETVIFYSLFFLLPQFYPWLFAIMATLVFFTVGQRVVWVWRHYK